MRKRSLVEILILGMGVVAGSPVRARPPELVSPVGLVEARCPTFSWSERPGAAGYELVIYGVSAAGEVGQEPLLSARLPAGASSWTPSSIQCLVAGTRYAWSLRVVGQEGEGWSEPALFEVAAGPSLREVEAAVTTLRRYPVEARETVELPKREAAALLGETSVGRKSLTAASVPSLGSPSLTVDANVALGAASNLFKDGSVFLWDDTTGNTALGRLALASATGTADGNTAVGREALRYAVGQANYDVYGSYNTAVGVGALRSNTIGHLNTASGFKALYFNTTGTRNTASGDLALFSNTMGGRNTANGYRALFSNTTGFHSTASGDGALSSNTTGFANTAIGSSALSSNSTGVRNTACGSTALFSNTTGSRNTAIGDYAGLYATTGNDNIFLGSGAQSVAGESNTIRIGGANGAGIGQQNRAFIAGVRNIITTNNDAIPVLIDSARQLGTFSSSRSVKQDIDEIGERSRRLMGLRPVAFRYRQHVAVDPETPLQFGLIAEEVAEVMPELVVLDDKGRPETVKYHLLAALLLNELQRADQELEKAQTELAAQRREIEIQREELVAFRERIAALERSGVAGPLPFRW